MSAAERARVAELVLDTKDKQRAVAALGGLLELAAKPELENVIVAALPQAPGRSSAGRWDRAGVLPRSRQLARPGRRSVWLILPGARQRLGRWSPPDSIHRHTGTPCGP